jgi:cupin fold WbuC family metalloprotein
MERILHNGKLVGLKINSFPEGTVSATEEKEALQILTLKHPAGKVVAPHRHISHVRTTEHLQECIVVIRGRIRLSFFDDKANIVASVEVGNGEACVTLSGGHSVEFLEDSEVIELKNGPYFNDRETLVSEN